MISVSHVPAAGQVLRDLLDRVFEQTLTREQLPLLMLEACQTYELEVVELNNLPCDSPGSRLIPPTQQQNRAKDNLMQPKVGPPPPSLKITLLKEAVKVVTKKEQFTRRSTRPKEGLVLCEGSERSKTADNQLHDRLRAMLAARRQQQTRQAWAAQVKQQQKLKRRKTATRLPREGPATYDYEGGLMPVKEYRNDKIKERAVAVEEEPRKPIWAYSEVKEVGRREQGESKRASASEHKFLSKQDFYGALTPDQGVKILDENSKIVKENEQPRKKMSSSAYSNFYNSRAIATPRVEMLPSAVAALSSGTGSQLQSSSRTSRPRLQASRAVVVSRPLLEEMIAPVEWEPRGQVKEQTRQESKLSLLDRFSLGLQRAPQPEGERRKATSFRLLPYRQKSLRR